MDEQRRTVQLAVMKAVQMIGMGPETHTYYIATGYGLILVKSVVSKGKGLLVSLSDGTNRVIGDDQDVFWAEKGIIE